MKPLITNIQRFCLHDGPGIRTTVFFKGCTLHCPWCANPENISRGEELYYIQEKCKEECTHILDCRKRIYQGECVFNAIGKWGDYYSPQRLYDILIKDKSFYGKEGGITFSGGEPLMFLPNYYSGVCDELHQCGINLCVETALFVPEESVKWLIGVADCIYIDIKILDYSKCKSILGGNLEQYLNNLRFVYENKGDTEVTYRVPLIHGYTDTKDNINSICSLVQKFPMDKVEILKAHNLGKKKYERLGRKYDDFYAPNDSVINLWVQEMRDKEIEVEVKQA